MEIYNDIGLRLGTAISELDGRNRNSKWLRELVTPDAEGVKRLTIEQLVDLSIMPIIKGIQQRSSLVDIACSIGKKLRSKNGYKACSLSAMSGGLVILEAFADAKFVATKRTKMRGKNQKRKKHPEYKVFVEDWGNYDALLESLLSRDIEESPLMKPAENWTSGFHPENNDSIIRHGNMSALKKVSETINPLVLGALNKLQQTGYRINKEVLEVYKECFHLETNSPFKHSREEDAEVRNSLLLEASAIRDLASKNIDNSFYHRYSCDFRGRIYPGTAFLHEQSSDNAKGLIRYDFGVPLGEMGAWFLAVHTANSIGKDKLPLEQRVHFTNKAMWLLCKWAEDPMKYRGWVKCDKPWSTLACAFEWRKIHEHVIVEGKSHLTQPLYFIGSSAHLHKSHIALFVK